MTTTGTTMYREYGTTLGASNSTGSITISGIDGGTYEWYTPSGTGVKLSTNEEVKEGEGIHPRLYFKYVKSKMTKL